ELERLSTDGSTSKALALLDTWNTQAILDCDLHLRIAAVCEELGQSKRLLDELNYAYRDDRSRHSILKRIALVHLDAGRTERAEHCYRTLTHKMPGDVEGWSELGALLREMDRSDEARHVYDEGFAATGSGVLQAASRALKSGRRQQLNAAEDDDGGISSSVLARFVELFRGQDGVYAKQWAQSRIKTGYSPVEQPFTHVVARNHLMGGITIGIYTVRADSTTRYCALDLDLDKSIVRDHEPESPVWTEAMNGLHEFALTLSNRATELGIRNYIEDSGGKGRHLWCFFERPLSARLARRFG
ncbi:unnamed protein product, partial [Phaeothamnion confervicola]